MKIKSVLAFLIIIAGCNLSSAQHVLTLDTTIRVVENGSDINKAWAGGVDCPMYSAMDINNDGVKDLIIFDHKTNRLTTYINNNTTGISYRYAPEYEQYFPSMHDWIKLYDYNCDGHEDIFTHGNGGIACYRNNGTNPVSFTFVTPQINSFYHFGSSFFLSNIYVSSVNVPSFVDIDNDGDMDVISFPLGASYIEYHKNYSMDSLGICSGFKFYNIRVCWGYFTLQGNGNIAVLPPASINSGNCPTFSATYPRSSGEYDKADIIDTLRHSGNILEGIDIDDDGDKDLITGDIVATTVLLVVNGGNPDSAYAVSQDTLFPSYDTPAILENIPSPFIVDVNNDGKKDMMVSNFNSDMFQGAGENYYNTLLYENISPNPNAYQFHYIKNTFMTDEMVDIGTGAHPVLFDVDGDGLKDLLIGSDYFYYTGGVRKGQITLYKNIGTSTDPRFELVTRDYAGLAAYTFSGIYPTLGDIDGDGDADMILGNSDASVTLCRNTAGPGNPCSFVVDSTHYQNISVGSVGMQSIPVLYDVNKDSKLDLIIGKRTGTLYYYENTGTANNPVFTYVTDHFGDVDVHDPLNLLGYSAPLFYDSAGITQLLVGTYNGHLYKYNNIDNNLGGTFTLLDSVFQNIYEPTNAVPAMADLNGDGLYDLIIGNLAGGIRYYSQHIVGIADITPDPVFNCYPNPVSGILNLDFSSASPGMRNVKMIDVLGNTVLTKRSSAKSLQLDVTELAAGSYIVTVDDNGKEVTQKVIIY